nr:hypothetical protein [Psychrobacillus vulpis]
MNLKRPILINYVIYFVLLIVTGYVISYFSNSQSLFNGYGSMLWLITFLILSFSFSPIRELIIPLINGKPLTKLTTYFYIMFATIVPYLLLKLLVKYEILIDRNLLISYKLGLLRGLDFFGLIDVMIFAPIWEEIFFQRNIIIYFIKTYKACLGNCFFFGNICTIPSNVSDNCICEWSNFIYYDL